MNKTKLIKLVRFDLFQKKSKYILVDPIFSKETSFRTERAEFLHILIIYFYIYFVCIYLINITRSKFTNSSPVSACLLIFYILFYELLKLKFISHLFFFSFQILLFHSLFDCDFNYIIIVEYYAC